ncbi:MAG: hypothetical protein ACYCXF_02675 [Thermoleophilia bacterium]
MPSFSARGLIEVKRTTTEVDKHRKQLAERREALPFRYQRYILGVVVRHNKPLFESIVDPDWVESQEDDDQPPLTRLLSEDGRPDTDGIFALIYMLSHLVGHRGALGSNDRKDS